MGDLFTDIYIKETDSRAFLNFNSCHPNHTFSSIIYSQALRYRRIINDDQLLKQRLDELKQYFIMSNYPISMTNNIINKVASLPRLLEEKTKNNQKSEKVIKVISTHGRDELLCNISKLASKVLIDNKVVSKFEYVKKTAPSLKNKLCNSKYISLEERNGPSRKCKRSRCKNCKRMSGLNRIVDSNGKKHNSAGGDCTSRNIIYAATCQLCQKNYTGKSTQMCACRNSGHLGKYTKYIKDMEKGGDHQKYTLDDEYSLAIHLHNEHNITDIKGFDMYYKFTLLENCSPKNLATREHLWIQKLRSLYPYGLNLVSPFGLPLLN